MKPRIKRHEGSPKWVEPLVTPQVAKEFGPTESWTPEELSAPTMGASCYTPPQVFVQMYHALMLVSLAVTANGRVMLPSPQWENNTS